MINYVKETSCRFCGGELSSSILSLGKLYPSNFSTEESDPEDKIPLSLVDCKECGLVQLEHTVDRDELYRQYWYRSGLNDSMVRDLQDVVNHAEKYLEDGEVVVDIGCFKSGTPILMGDYTTEPIENLTIGDTVFTHTGKRKQIISTLEREYSGDFYKITTQHKHVIECTEEHPILTLKKGTRIYEENLKFIPAKDITLADYVAVPRLKSLTNEREITQEDKDKFFLYGWFLAEGHALYSHKPRLAGIGLTLGIHEEEYVELIENAGRRLGMNVTKSVRPKKSTIDIRIYSKDFAESLVTLFGKGAKEKFIHNSIFEEPDELKIILMQALFNGDGHYRELNRGGKQYSLSSRSSDLLEGVRKILRQFGVSSYRYDYKGQPWYITISGESVSLLTEGEVKYKGVKHTKKLENYILVRVKDIKKYKDSCRVYNFEVEDDNSYIVNDVAVHNCNDGTMLGLYSKPVYRIGVDPAKNVGNITGNCDLFINDYFPTDSFPKNKKAKVITAIAMFYDLPVIKEFMQGVVDNLVEDGVFIVQFTDLTTTLRINAFDNLVHEHLEYYTLLMLDKIAREFGLELIDVSYNMVNGGSLRVTLSRYGQYLPTMVIHKYLFEEHEYLQTDNLYMLSERIEKYKNTILGFIKDKDVAVMSASTKGNTLLQVFGIDNTMISHAAEINEDKFGLKTVGTNIPIISEEESLKNPPDYYLILAWHFIDNLIGKHMEYLEQGGSFLVPLPSPAIYRMKEGEIVYEELR